MGIHGSVPLHYKEAVLPQEPDRLGQWNFVETNFAATSDLFFYVGISGLSFCGESALIGSSRPGSPSLAK